MSKHNIHQRHEQEGISAVARKQKHHCDDELHIPVEEHSERIEALTGIFAFLSRRQGRLMIAVLLMCRMFRCRAVWLFVKDRIGVLNGHGSAEHLSCSHYRLSLGGVKILLWHC